MLEEQAFDSTVLQRLRWMPAHRGQSSIHHARRSDGFPITAVDWRANRLVDALAKAAAQEKRVPRHVMQYVEDAAAALEYAAAKLGTVTNAANNFRCTVVLPDGSTAQCIKRDSAAQKRPRGSQTKRETPTSRPASSSNKQDVGLLPTGQFQLLPARRRAAQCSDNRLSKRQRLLDHECSSEMRFQAYWMANRPAMRPSSPERASTRLAKLRARIVEQEAASRAVARACHGW